MMVRLAQGVLVGVTVLWALPFFVIGYIVNAAYVGFQIGCGVVSAWANRHG